MRKKSYIRGSLLYNMERQHFDNHHTGMIFQCPLCNSVPEDQREDFMRDVRFSVKNYEKGDVIVTQGAIYESLYILVRGEIITEMADEKGDFMKVAHISAPNPLATGFLFATNNRSPVSAICRMPSTAVVIPKENVYFLMRKYESFMLAFLSYISNRVSSLSEKLRLISLRTIRAKLAYYLLKESAGKQSFRLGSSKEEIARLFSVSRPALVKVMMEMAAEGVIEVDRRDVIIRDRAALQKMF